MPDRIGANNLPRFMTPELTQQIEAASRECAESVQQYSHLCGGNVSHVEIEKIIRAAITKLIESLEKELEEMKKLARQACDERYETEQQATYERIRRNNPA